MEPKLSDVRADQMDGEEMEILFPRQLQAERIKRDVSTATEVHVNDRIFYHVRLSFMHGTTYLRFVIITSTMQR